MTGPVRHKVLYIPGLGDKSLDGRRMLTKFWHYRRISIDVVGMDWSVDEPWQTKLDRLIRLIDDHVRSGYAVSLVGESAGASAAVSAFGHRRDVINAVILLCGKSQYPERLSPVLRHRNPALWDAVDTSSQVISGLTTADKIRFLNFRPLSDPVVPVSETAILGVRNALIPSVGHAVSIIIGASFWSFVIAGFIRRSSRPVSQYQA